MDAIHTAFTALRSDRLASPERWQPIYRSGLIAAFQERRFDEAADLAVFAASALDSQGHFQAALDELDFALLQEPASPDATVDLLAAKALFLAISGSDECISVIEGATSLRAAITRPAALLALDAQMVMVDLLLLRPRDLGEISQLAARARAEGAESHSFAVEAFAIPLLVARGDVRRGRPWAVALLARTSAAEAHYRSADVAGLGMALRLAEQLAPPSLEPVMRVARNTHAAFRARTSAVRAALLRGDVDDATRELEALRGLASRVNPGLGGNLPALEWAVGALGGGGAPAEVPMPEPPSMLTLANLPGVLAALETVATVGRQDEAVMWDRWLHDHWPAHIVTSLEWGASVERLRALIDVRVGREAAGLARMQRAVDWAKTAGFVVEQHLAEVQLAEMMGLISSNVSSRRWRELRDRGRAAFAAVGGDPLPVAYAVSDAVAVGRIEGSEPKLSPREVEVLAQFAAGLTYREAALQLGIEWRTVQVHAKHIYAKLGVHAKIPAIRRAEELGIL